MKIVLSPHNPLKLHRFFPYRFHHFWVSKETCKPKILRSIVCMSLSSSIYIPKQEEVFICQESALITTVYLSSWGIYYYYYPEKTARKWEILHPQWFHGWQQREKPEPKPHSGVLLGMRQWNKRKVMLRHVWAWCIYSPEKAQQEWNQ